MNDEKNSYCNRSNIGNISKSEACQIYNEESGIFAILYIGSEVEQRDSVQLITNASSSMMLESNITSQLNEIIEQEKLRKLNIENLDEILAEVETNIMLSTYINDGTGEEDSMESTSSDISYILSLVLGMMLYMIIILYGSIDRKSVV